MGQVRMAKSPVDEPTFTLPPHRIEQVFTAASETMDWGLTLLGIPQLWRLTKGAGVKVAILDTGVALNHPDLKSSILKTKDFTRSKAGPSDVNGHGSHAAGIVAARENSTGVIGVAPECSLLIGKILGDNGSGTLKSVVSGIRWAIKEKADIISMSLGSAQGSDELENACREASEAGIFIVAAAGNEGPSIDTVNYPALYNKYVVAVGAIDQKSKICNFSSRGKAVDIVAPGNDILSCYPPRSLAKLSGTSMACPFVAGVVALMIAKHRQYGSNYNLKSQADLLLHLKRTAIDLGPRGFDTNYGYGLINPTSLLVEAKTTTGTIRSFPLAPEDVTPEAMKKIQKFFGDTPFAIQVNNL